MSLFDFNGDGKTSLTEGMIGASIVSNAINALNSDEENSKDTQEAKSNTPKTVPDKEWKNVMGWCVRIIIGTAAIPAIIWLFSVAERVFTSISS